MESSKKIKPLQYLVINQRGDGSCQALTMNVRFMGQCYDQVTGLHYNYFQEPF